MKWGLARLNNADVALATVLDDFFRMIPVDVVGTEVFPKVDVHEDSIGQLALQQGQRFNRALGSNAADATRGEFLCQELEDRRFIVDDEQCFWPIHPTP